MPDEMRRQVDDGDPLAPGRTAACEQPVRNEGVDVRRIDHRATAAPSVSRAGVSCLLMARDGKTAQREPARQGAPARQPVPRPDGDEPLPPPDDPMSYTYTTDLAAIRAVVHRYAIQAGLTEARAIDLTLAVSEVAANTVKHAKSPGSLEIWYDSTEIVCQIHDEGIITDPLAGRRQPSLDALGGHGLWIVNQVCDQVEIHSDETGTTIRLHMNLPRTGAGH
jgi:anti-sigma regulatory factor (Ser/Thr protein kinase)